MNQPSTDERRQWFETNRHMMSEGMQQRFLVCLCEDETYTTQKAEIDRLRSENSRLNRGWEDEIDQNTQLKEDNAELRAEVAELREALEHIANHNTYGSSPDLYARAILAKTQPKE